MYRFQKLHGIGNDFIIFDGINQDLPQYSGLAKKVCNRHFGIGADGMIVVEQSQKADIKMVFFNADGTQAPMCGNGIRCFSKFVYENNLVNKKDFTVDTLAGIMKPKLFVKNNEVIEVKVNLGKPIFKPNIIPIKTEEDEFINKSIEVCGKKFDISAVMVGSVHAVIFVDDLSQIDIEHVGPAIEKHELFPKGINVNFCKVVKNNKLEILTWERGVGQTLACGTGASSCAVISKIVNNTAEIVDISLLGGNVKIEQKDNNVYMTGPAQFICNGQYNYCEE